ncbi:3-deoxy-D-manno-octulosonic acid transferase [Verrucomicrobiota bacterium]
MIWLIYNLIFPLVFLCMLPFFLMRMYRRGGYRDGFEQRFGVYSAEIKAKLEAHNYIWVHSVSVGEILVAFSFMDEYRKAHPNMRFVLTTNTSTAHKMARERLDERDVLLYFPIDLPWIVARVLKMIDPLKLVLVECELWPNLLRMADKRGVPLCLINGRMSDNSFKGYKRIGFLTRPILELFRTVCVQSEMDAGRYRELGVGSANLHQLGSAKFDVAKVPEGATDKGRAVLRQLGVADDAPVLLGGSTWPGEEALLIDVYQALREKHPDLFLVLVPRHFERASELMPLFEEKGVRCVRRSQLADDSVATPDLLFVDTTGEIMNFYANADIVFVGKSFEPNHGGQNPIEPAACGKPVLVGPNMENFPSVMDDMLRGGALVQLSAPDELLPEIARLLDDEEARKIQGQKAEQLVLSKLGVMTETVKQVG